MQKFLSFFEKRAVSERASPMAAKTESESATKSPKPTLLKRMKCNKEINAKIHNVYQLVL